MPSREGSSAPGVNALRSWISKVGEAYQRDLKERMISLLSPSPGCRVLDCGCGDGSFTLAVAQRLEANLVVGIDIFTSALRLAKRLGLNVVRGDLNAPMPFAADSFDVATANLLVASLGNTDTFLQELKRVLRPGACCVLTTPNLSSPHHLLFLFLGWQPLAAHVSDEVIVGSRLFDGMGAVPGYPLSRRNFAPAGLKGLMAHHGFYIETVCGVGFWPLPSLLARAVCTLDRVHPVYLVLKVRKPQ